MSEWIPCEKRLPAYHERVMLTIQGSDIVSVQEGESFEDALERVSKKRWVMEGFLGSDGWYGIDYFPLIVNPIAWMPLPEPWKGEEE